MGFGSLLTEKRKPQSFSCTAQWCGIRNEDEIWICSTFVEPAKATLLLWELVYRNVLVFGFWFFFSAVVEFSPNLIQIKLIKFIPESRLTLQKFGIIFTAFREGLSRAEEAATSALMSSSSLPFFSVFFYHAPWGLARILPWSRHVL